MPGEKRREETFQSKFRNRNSKLIDLVGPGPRHTGITLDIGTSDGGQEFIIGN